MKFKSVKYTSYISFFLTFLLLYVFFIDEKTSRVIFYLDGYLSVIGFVILIIGGNITLKNLSLTFPFIIMGVILLSWSLICSLFGGEISLLYTSAKRYVLAFFIISFLLSSFQSSIIDRERIKKYAEICIWTSFLSTSLYGIYLSSISNERLLLGIDRPTLTAYAYSLLSLSLLMKVFGIKSKFIRVATFNIISVVSIYIVFHTQTRAAMAIHTLMLVILAIKVTNIKKDPFTFAITLIIISLSISGNSNIISKRSSQALSDITQYSESNDKTSLGARFTMWKVGLASFENMPLGETLNYRNKYITQYLDKSGESHSDAFKYLDVHLHNETIQYASTLGIFGVIVLFYFYYFFIIILSKKFGIYNPLSFPMLAILIYGFTDVILTSNEMVVIITAITAVNLVIMIDCKIKNK